MPALSSLTPCATLTALVAATAILWPSCGNALPSDKPGITRPDFLIENWLSSDGLPENSTLSIAQTHDGYLWIGTSSGLARFNGFEFTPIGPRTDLRRLNHAVGQLYADRAGRLWVSTDFGLAVLEQGRWQRVESTNVQARTIAEDRAGRVFIGTFQGELFLVGTNSAATNPAAARELKPFPLPAGVTPSGLFCCTDLADGDLWVANRGFVGRLGTEGWRRLGPEETARDSVVAAPARKGGLWVYTPGRLLRYRENQALQTYPAPSLRGPRAIMEDHAGALWIASTPDGVIRVRPGGEWTTFSGTNALTQSSAIAVFEDAEQNVWVGSSSGGLTRFRERRIQSFGFDDGLPDQIVRTVTEEAPGRILVGTHGGGKARIENGKVVWTQPLTGPRPGAHVWSVLRDKAGRTWTGTYYDGLFVEENGVERRFPLSPRLDRTIYALFEDSHGVIWVGTLGGLGIVRAEQVGLWSPAKDFAPLAVRGIGEDVQGKVMWLGTYSRGLWRVEGSDYRQVSVPEGLPGERISSLFVDKEGWVWAGVFGHGLVCVHDGSISRLGPEQGLFPETIGAIVEDGLGWIWLGSNRGIWRVSLEELRRVVRGELARAKFLTFDRVDGLPTLECAEGYQPTAVRDSAGHLWFATLQGVVALDPRALRLNSRRPPIVIEQVGFTDESSARHELFDVPESGLILPPGSHDLQIRYAALSYTAPEKNRYAYRFGTDTTNWVDVGHSREIRLTALQPGAQRIEIKGANNDEVWSEPGRTIALVIQPFFWQTWWFRVFGVCGALGGVGFATWRLARRQLQLQIERLQQQRAIERERARLAAVMEATSDLVFFADANGRVLHLNPAGRRMLGYAPMEELPHSTIGDLHAERIRSQIIHGSIPTAVQEGLWQGDTVLARRDGRELPVSEVIVAHRDEGGKLNYLSGIVRDILDRKRAEDALRESEERLRASIECTPNVAVQWFDTAGRVLLWNGACESIFGWKAGEALGKTLDQLMHTPEEAAQFVRVLQQVQRTGHPQSPSESSFRRRNGNAGICLSTVFPIPSREGQATFVRMDVDITEGKQAEAALRQKTEELDRYFTSSLDLLCIADTDGYFRRLNPEWTRTLGHSLTDLVGRRLLDWVHPDDLASTLEALQRLNEESEVLNLTNRFRCQDGAYRWLEWRAFPRGRSLYAVARDITERKRVEDLLQKLATSFVSVSSDELFFRVCSHLATTLEMEFACVAELSPDLKRMLVRGGIKNGERLVPFEYDMAGTPCESVVGQALRVYTREVQTQFPNDPLLAELSAQSYIGCPLFDHTGKALGGCLAVSRRPLEDATLARTLFKLVTSRLEAELEHRRAEEEKSRLQAQLIQAHKMESVGRLAGGVAHDFNNMLQVILGNAALTLNQTAPGQPLHDDLLEIQKAARRSADLTRQLLAFARKQTVNPKVLSLNDTIGGMLKMLRRLIGEDIELVWVPAHDLWPINVDPAQIDQILANLAANARDAIASTGRVTIETANVVLDAMSAQMQPDCVPGPYVLLAVSDTGRGMSREVQDHLFEPFFTTKDVGKGTGLGLATVFGIVKQNHGFISVYSELEHGTTFKIYLPRARGAAEAVEDTATLPTHGTETVLLVEDEEQILNLGRKILQQQGYVVLAARFPEDAIRLARQHESRIHLLITDVVMPGMNGRQLKDEIERIQPELKCLFMSGYTANVIAHHGVLDEGVRFLQKPFTLTALAAKVREILDAPAR